MHRSTLIKAVGQHSLGAHHRLILNALTSAFHRGQVGPQYWVVAARAVAALDTRGAVHTYRSAHCRASLVSAVQTLLTKRPFESSADQHFSRLLSFTFAPHGGQSTHVEALLHTVMPVERIVLQIAVLARAKSATPMSLAMALANCADPCGEFGATFNEQVDQFVMPAWAAESPVMKHAASVNITADDARPARFFKALFDSWTQRRYSTSRDLSDAIFAVLETGRVLRALNAARAFPAVYGELDIDAMLRTTLAFTSALTPILRVRSVTKADIRADVSAETRSALRVLPEEPTVEPSVKALDALVELKAMDHSDVQLVCDAATVAAAIGLTIRSIASEHFIPRATKADVEKVTRVLRDTLVNRLGDFKKQKAPEHTCSTSEAPVNSKTLTSSTKAGTSVPVVDMSRILLKMERSIATLNSVLANVAPRAVAGPDAVDSTASSLAPKREDHSTVMLDAETTFAVLARLREITRSCLADAAVPTAAVTSTSVMLSTTSAEADAAATLAASPEFAERASALLVNASRRTATSLSNQLLWHRFMRSVVALGGALSSLSDREMASLAIAVEAEIMRQCGPAGDGTVGAVGDNFSFALGLLESLSRLPHSHIVASSVRRCCVVIMTCLERRCTKTSIGSIPLRELHTAPGFTLEGQETPSTSAGIQLRAHAFALSSIARSHYSRARNVDFRADIEPGLLDSILTNMKSNLMRDFDIPAFGTLMFAAPRVGLTMADMMPFIHTAMKKVAMPPTPTLVQVEGVSKLAPEIVPSKIVRVHERNWMNLGEVVAVVDALNMLECRDRPTIQWIIQLHGQALAYTKSDLLALAELQRRHFKAATRSVDVKTGVLSAEFYEASQSSFDFGSERIPCGIIVRAHQQRLRRLVRRSLNPEGTSDMRAASTPEVQSEVLHVLRHLRTLDFHINDVLPRAAINKIHPQALSDGELAVNTAPSIAPANAARVTSTHQPAAAPSPPTVRAAPAAPTARAAPPPPKPEEASAVAKKPTTAVERALSQRAASQGTSGGRGWKPSHGESADGLERHPVRHTPPASNQQRRDSPQRDALGGSRQAKEHSGAHQGRAGNNSNRRPYLKPDETRAVLERTFNEMLGRTPATAVKPPTPPPAPTEAPASAPRVVKVVRRLKPADTSDE